MSGFCSRPLLYTVAVCVRLGTVWIFPGGWITFIHKEDKKLNFLSFCPDDQVLGIVNKVKYLRHIIRDDLCHDDDDDILGQCCKFYAQANTLAWKFMQFKCTDLKTALFRSYCPSLCTAHLWWKYSVSKMENSRWCIMMRSRSSFYVCN